MTTSLVLINSLTSNLHNLAEQELEMVDCVCLHHRGELHHTIFKPNLRQRLAGVNSGAVNIRTTLVGDVKHLR